MCLCRVFEQRHAGRCVADRGDVGGMAVDVHGEDDLRPLGDGGCHQPGIHGPRVVRDVDVHGHGATADDGFRRREERVRDGHDLVSGSYVERFERQFDGHRAVGERHRVLDAGEGRELLLERGGFGPADEVLAGEHALDASPHLRFDCRELRLEVDERDRRVRHRRALRPRRGTAWRLRARGRRPLLLRRPRRASHGR